MRRRRRSYRRGKNHIVRNIIISCFMVTLFLATGYSAFQTVISINAKGNKKNIKLILIQTVDILILIQNMLEQNMVLFQRLQGKDILLKVGIVKIC